MEDRNLTSRVVTALRRAKVAHKDGRIFDIFNDFDLLRDIIGYTGENAKQLEIALEFLASWQDCAEHDDFLYKSAPFPEDEWPHISDSIIDDLDARRPISDSRVVAEFTPQPPKPAGPSLITRLRNWWSEEEKPPDS